MSLKASRQQDLAVLHPVIRESVKRVQEQLDEEKLPFRVFEAYRTPERQRLLYRQGRDVPGDIVTKARAWDSYHQYGLAVDFVLYISGSWSWKSTGQYAKMWQRLHVIGRQHGLEPLSWESPHLQYAKTSIDKLKAGDYPTGGDEAWAEQIAAAIAGWAGEEDAPPAPRGAILRPAIETNFDDDESDVQTFGSVSDPKASGFQSRPELGLTEDVIQGAQASDRLWGVPASVTLAQFILESAFGKKMPPGSNNPFGIKAKGDQPFVKARTIEYVHGREQVAYANFRKFSSFDEAFAQHGRLFATSSHYAAAMSVRDDPLAFANALTGIYATDPKYGSSLIKLIGQYELTSYDVSTSTGAASVSIQETSRRNIKGRAARNLATRAKRFARSSKCSRPLDTAWARSTVNSVV